MEYRHMADCYFQFDVAQLPSAVNRSTDAGRKDCWFFPADIPIGDDIGFRYGKTSKP